MAGHVYHFGHFRLDERARTLLRDGEPVSITPKVFDTLHFLVSNAGRPVSREELIRAVWPDTFVEEGNLNYNLSLLRKILGEHALGTDVKPPAFIETLPRRGYQFVAPIQEDIAADAAEPFRSGHGKLVGRHEALDRLWEYLGTSLGGQRRIVFVTGEPGVGKTTLVDEFQRQVEAGSALRNARGQCVEGYGGMEAYYPMLEAVGKLCRQSGGASVVQLLASHAPMWLAQFPALVTHKQRETLHRELFGATRERMLREIGDALETFTATTPLLLVLEDLQWVDPSTVDLISALARGRAPAKLMLIGTYRPMDISSSEHPLNRVKQDLLVHQLCYEMTLEPLGEIDVVEYMGAGAITADLPVGLAGLVHRHSGGNPLFMVTALEHMTQRGFISRENGTWKLNVSLEEIDLEVPENIRTMIEAEIERLSAEQQHVLEVASVTGVSFTASVNATAAALDDEKFEDLCEDLSRREHMVRSTGSHQFPDGTVSQRYEFAHALYREVFYHRQAPRRRANLHLRIAERLENLFSKHETQIAAQLAEHFEEASDWPRAVKYLRLAADSAKRRYAYRAAVALLLHAAQLLNRLPEPDRETSEMEVLEQLAMFYVALLDVRAAIKTYEKLIALAARRGLIDAQIRALADMAIPAAWTSAQLYMETVERALHLSAQQQDPLTRARTRAKCFGWRAMAGRWRPEDAKSCRKAMEEIERKGDRLVTAEDRLWYTYMQFLSSQYGDAHRTGVDSLAILFKQDDLNPFFVFYLEHVYRWLVLRNLLLWGGWGQVLKEVELATALLEKNGDNARGQEVLVHKAWVHLHAMDFSGVIAIVEPLFASVLAPSPVRDLHILIGSAEAGLGNYDRALEHFLKVRDDLDRQPLMDGWYQSMSLQAGLAELWLRKGDLAQARREAERFLDVALSTAERTYQGLAWEANAQVAIAGQEWKRAEECIANGLSTIEDYEVPLAAWQVHGTAAELYARAGSNDLAEHHRELSRAVIVKLANSLGPEDPLRATFLSAPPIRKVLDYADRIGA